MLSPSSYFSPLHVERVNVVADKNLKIARTHRSSYFRFAMRREAGRGEEREKSARCVEPIDGLVTPARSRARFAWLLARFIASIRLRSRRNTPSWCFVFRLAGKKERFKPVAGSVRFNGVYREITR